MKLISLLYLFCFFAPIAFLIGYMAGAPRPVAPIISFREIDTRALPVSALDLQRNEGLILTDEVPWLVPNTYYQRQ